MSLSDIRSPCEIEAKSMSVTSTLLRLQYREHVFDSLPRRPLPAGPIRLEGRLLLLLATLFPRSFHLSRSVRVVTI